MIIRSGPVQCCMHYTLQYIYTVLLYHLSLSFIQHCPLSSSPPLPLVYSFPFSLFLPPSLFSLSPPHYHRLETGIFSYIHLITHSTSSRGSWSVMNSLFQYWLWVERHCTQSYFLLVHDRHTQHHHDTWYSYFISHSNLFFMRTVVLRLIYTAAVFTLVGGWWGLSLLPEGCILPVRLFTNNVPLKHTPGLPSKVFCVFWHVVLEWSYYYNSRYTL